MSSASSIQTVLRAIDLSPFFFNMIVLLILAGVLYGIFRDEVFIILIWLTGFNCFLFAPWPIKMLILLLLLLLAL